MSELPLSKRKDEIVKERNLQFKNKSKKNKISPRRFTSRIEQARQHTKEDDW
jgi:hypothetical protein